MFITGSIRGQLLITSAVSGEYNSTTSRLGNSRWKPEALGRLRTSQLGSVEGMPAAVADGVKWCVRRPVLDSTQGWTPTRQAGPRRGLSCREAMPAGAGGVQSFPRSSGVVGVRRREGVARLPPAHRHARDRGSRPRRTSLVLEVPGFRPGLSCRACFTARDPRKVIDPSVSPSLTKPCQPQLHRSLRPDSATS